MIISFELGLGHNIGSIDNLPNPIGFNLKKSRNPTAIIHHELYSICYCILIY